MMISPSTVKVNGATQILTLAITSTQILTLMHCAFPEH